MGRTTWVGLVVAVVGVALSGCQCGPATPACSDIVVSFNDPAAGAAVNSPFPATIKAVYASTGEYVPFDTATLSLADGGFSSTLPSGGGTTLTFQGVTATPGPKTLVASITKGSCGPDAADADSKIARGTRNVVVNQACTAGVPAATFPQDTAVPNGTLNLAELPIGTDLQVAVSATCATGLTVQLKNTSGVVVAGPVDISSGSATLAVPVAASFDGTLTFSVELLNAGVVVKTNSAAIDVHRLAPNCALTPIARQGPNTDADGTAANHQFSVTFAIGGTGSTGSLTSTIPGSSARAVSATDTTATLTAPASGDTTYTVTLACTDASGNHAQATTDVRVDYQAPGVSVTSPVLPPDGGALVVTTSPWVFVATTDADTVTECVDRLSGSTVTSVGCHTVTAGGFTDDVPFPLDGAYDVRIIVTDSVGNVGSVRFPTSVTLSGCGLGFIKPVNCPALVTSAQVSAGVYPFQTQSKPTCAGQTVTMTRADVLADGGVSTAVGVGSPATVAGNGSAAIPVAVSNGSYMFSATVQNVGVDGGTSVAECDVTVDLNGPVITSPVLSGSQTVVTINAGNDSSTDPGAQRVLLFNALVPVGGHVEVCTTQQVDPVTSISRTATATCNSAGGTSWYQLSASATSGSTFTFPEGTYSIKVVVVSGTTYLDSAAVPLFVDVTRPCLLTGSRRLPQDANADARLNIAELGAQAPKLEFALDPACGDADFSTLATSGPIVVKDVVGGALTSTVYNLAGDATLASGKFTVALTQNVANEKDYVFFVEVTDKAGNKNILQATGDPSSFPVRIDKVAPGCDITSPAAGQTLFGLAQVPAGQFGVSVSTAADVKTNGVSVTFGANPPRTLTPDTQTDVATTAFSVTGTNTYAVVATCTDQSGNPTSATTRNITIDLDPPTCGITAPLQQNQPTDTLLTSVAVTGAEGRQVTCSANGGGGLAPPMTVSGGTASATYLYPSGVVSLSCSVSDAAGNSCVTPVPPATWQFTVAATNGFHIALSPPVVSNANGKWYNRSNVTGIVGNTATATINANSNDSGAGVTVTLTRTAPTPGAPLSTTTAFNGDVSFPGVTLTEGETWEVKIVDGIGNRTDSFRVAFTAPTVSGVTVKGTTVAGGANIFIVAPQDNENVRTAQPGYFTSGDNAQGVVAFSVNGVTGARKFSADSTLEVDLGGAAVAGGSATLTTDPQSVSFPTLTLPQNSNAALSVRITDVAGNVTTVFSSPVQVDVIPPGAPVATLSIVSPRSASVRATWAQTFDDGATGGPHAGYKVRWTTSSVVGPTPTLDSAAFLAANAESDSAPAAVSRDLTLPPLNSYYVWVRAFDEVGNYSTLGLATPTPLDNFWGGTPYNAGTGVMGGTATLTGPAASAFGQNIVIASLNGDTIPDLVVAGPSRGTNIGSVYVYYGDGGISSLASCVAPGCQEIQPPTAVTGLFGTDISASGNVGDSAANEGKVDLLVAQPTFSGTVGRAILYFGTAAAQIDTATFIEFRGVTGYSYASAARIIKSIDGDALDEVLITAHAFNANQGRVFIFKGRSIAAWQALAAVNGGFVLPSQADWILDGPTPTATNGNQYGRIRFGIQSLGDLNGDGVPEFSIPQSKETDGTVALNQLQKVYIYSGAAVAATTAATPVATTSAAVLNILTPPIPLGTGSTTDAFGRSVVGGQNILGTRDLVVAYPTRNRIHVYSSPLLVAPAANSAETLTSTSGLFGYVTDAADVTGDGFIDIIGGTSQPGTTHQAWLMYQRPGATRFDTATGSFWSSEFRATATGSKLGQMVVLGDISGDGIPEVIVGDEGLLNVQIWKSN